MTAREFEARARDVMSRHYGVEWESGCRDLIKQFDMVSRDRTVVGDAKYFSLVRGKWPPPAKLSVIAEHVWLLEKTPAARRFLVFGNQVEVPQMWLKRFGHLCQGVRFYFLSEGGELETLK